MSRRDFLLTVDVEALPGRASRDRVTRLIWGDFGSGQPRAGVLEMAAIAGDAGVPVTFFVDMAETQLYGDGIRDCARILHESGHDVELHLHPELLPMAYWERSVGRTPQRRTQEFFDEAMALEVMTRFSRELTDATGQDGISAYRAGSFRIGKSMLAAQHRLGIPLTSNLSYESFLNQGRVPMAPPDAGPFRWTDGPVEIPITQIRQQADWKVLSLPMKLNGTSYERVLASLAEEDADTPVVMILHSWSLLDHRAGSREKYRPSPAKLDTLGDVVRLAKAHFNCIDFRTLHERIESGHVTLGRERKFLDHLNMLNPPPDRRGAEEKGPRTKAKGKAAPTKARGPKRKGAGARGTVRPETAPEQLQSEIVRLRRENAALVRARRQLETRAVGLERSVAFRLGHAVVLAFHAPRRLLELPRTVAQLYREGRTKHEGRRAPERAPKPGLRP